MCLSIRLSLIAILLTGISACSQKPQNRLEHIQETGVLQVISRNSPTSYYIGAEGPAGLDYDLAARFADYLGVELKIIVPVSTSDIVPMLRHGRADMAAAGLAVTELRSQQLIFGPAFMQLHQQLIYRPGNGRPASIDDLDGQLGVAAGSALEDRLTELQREHPQLQWTAYANKSQQELLEMVAHGELDYTVANSNEAAYAQRYYARIGVAFDISEDLDVAWAFRQGTDKSLHLAAQLFFAELGKTNAIAELEERYYGYIRQFDYVDAQTFLDRIVERLPDYLPTFKTAAAAEGFDWQLLAALSYQESHWDPHAQSPTGVRGMMMLTQPTAERVGVDDRTDPYQSIIGGARYLREVIDRMPERIPYPDRLWLALAAYNVGFGHLEDARILTEAAGANPDRWADVREYLPLLSQKQWYEQTTHGYARGREPVQFVRNIRGYYEVLAWLGDQRRVLAMPLPQIESPVL